MAPCNTRSRGTLGTANRTISQMRRIWLLLSWTQRMNRACLSVSFISHMFLSYHPFSFHFCLLSVCCDRLEPTPFHALSSPNDRLFPHQARVASHEAIPYSSCSFAQLSSAMASSWLFFTTSIQSFSISHFPETSWVLKLECRVDFFHF